jgi:SPP1 family predicted phage head-tail adaptor
LLTAAELSAIRTTAADALPDTAIIQNYTSVSDGGGGQTQTWTAAGTMDCRIAPIVGMGANEDQSGGRISADAQFIVTLPYNAAVTTDSRLVIDSNNYNVEAIRERSWNATTRVEVKKEV